MRLPIGQWMRCWLGISIHWLACFGLVDTGTHIRYGTLSIMDGLTIIVVIAIMVVATELIIAWEKPRKNSINGWRSLI